jgi:hypothetical protein
MTTVKLQQAEASGQPGQPGNHVETAANWMVAEAANAQGGWLHMLHQHQRR